MGWRYTVSLSASYMFNLSLSYRHAFLLSSCSLWSGSDLAAVCRQRPVRCGGRLVGLLGRHERRPRDVRHGRGRLSQWVTVEPQAWYTQACLTTSNFFICSVKNTALSGKNKILAKQEMSTFMTHFCSVSIISCLLAVQGYGIMMWNSGRV